jgi:hypothetical protein
MVYSNRPIGKDITGFLPGSLNQVDGNRYTVSTADGSVLSVQPNGDYQTRAAGTTGEYEVGERDGNLLIFTPGGNVWPVIIGGQ